MTSHLVIPDPHAHFEHHNKRAELLGHLIVETKPDVVIMIGDLADMPSLASFDKGKKNFQGRSYRADIDCAIDFNDRLWGTVRKAKKRMPRRIAQIGNHEQRILTTINIQPELEGTISIADLEYERYYDEIVPYVNGSPGVINVDGINYAHFFVSGVMGRPISGEHPAASLIQKQLSSCTAGHIHTADYSIRTDATGRKLHGLLAGCCFDYASDWAGEANKLYWRGAVLKRNVYQGQYDPQFISLDWMRKQYG